MAKIAELNIDGYIGRESGEFSLSSLNTFLSSLDSGVTDIHIHINSGGGSVDEGFAIYDKLKSTPYNITTIGEGIVGSIATVIYMAGDTRKIFKNSKFFIHNPYVIPYGDAMESKDAQRLADELRIEEERILNFYIDNTGKSKEEIKPYMDAQTSFNSKDALSMGFITEIVDKAIANKVEYKLVAYINPKTIKEEQMEKTEQLNWFNKLESMIKNLMPKVKNEMTKTSEGVEIWYEGTLEVGTKIYTDESMTTPAPDGVHTIGNAEAMVNGGVVTELKEVASSNEEALKAEIETLKASIAASNAAKSEAEAKLTVLAESVNELSNEIVNFKKVVIGGEAPKSDTQNFSKEKKAVSKMDVLAEKVKNKYSKK